MTEPIEVDWDILKSEWDERDIDKIRKQLIALKVLPDPLHPDVHQPRLAHSLRRSKTALSSPNKYLESPQEELNDYLHRELKKCDTWLQAFEVPGAARLLAFFPFAWGMNMWELSSERNKVRTRMAGACTGYLSAYRKAKDIADAKDTATATQRERLREYLSGEQELVHLILNRLTMPVDLTELQMPAESPLYGALLVDAMSVESAVYSGSTVATHYRANEIRKLCDAVLEHDLDRIGGSCNELREILREVVVAHQIYFGCIAQVARAFESAGGGDRDAIARFDAVVDLDDALKDLTNTQGGLDDEVYASELSAYRVALKAWRDKLSSPVEPKVLLNSAQITYIYPFTISGVKGVEAQQIALRRPGDPKFNGLSPEQPVQQELTDMWTWGGRRESLNGTVKLPMPDLTVKLDDDPGSECTYKVELRFNDLGNHYLRLQLPLTDPTINDINQALRRATIYSGEHDLIPRGRCSRGQQTTIAQYAEYVIVDAAAWMISETKSENIRCWERLWRKRYGRKSTQEVTTSRDKHGVDPHAGAVNRTTATSECENLDEDRAWWKHFSPSLRNAKEAKKDSEIRDISGFKPDFDYHVVVVINTASISQPDGPPVVATKADIEEAYGSVLLQLLNREATTLDEWICWGRSPACENLLGDACFPSDFALGTQSTTVLYMPSTPRWSRNGYEEVAEFAASFPPLIRERKNNLDDKFANADQLTQKDDDRRIPDQEAKLDRLRSGLHEAVDEIRQVRTYLVPSQLLSLSAEGKFLEQLYRRSRLPELRKDIDSYIERGRITIDRMNARETRLHDHRNRKSQDRIQFILLLVGFCSLSGIFTLALTVWYGSQIPGWDSPFTKEQPAEHSYHDMKLIVVIYGVVFIVGLLFFFVSTWWMRTRRRRRRADSRWLQGRH